MDSGPEASLCHGEHIRVQRMSCRVIEGFTLVHRINRKGLEQYRIGRLRSRNFSTQARSLLRGRNGGEKRNHNQRKCDAAVAYPSLIPPNDNDGKKYRACEPEVATNRLPRDVEFLRARRMLFRESLGFWRWAPRA